MILRPPQTSNFYRKRREIFVSRDENEKSKGHRRRAIFIARDERFLSLARNCMHAHTGDFYRKRREIFISCEKLHTCAHEQFLSREIYR